MSQNSRPRRSCRPEDYSLAEPDSDYMPEEQRSNASSSDYEQVSSVCTPKRTTTSIILLPRTIQNHNQRPHPVNSAVAEGTNDELAADGTIQSNIFPRGQTRAGQKRSPEENINRQYNLVKRRRNLSAEFERNNFDYHIRGLSKLHADAEFEISGYKKNVAELNDEIKEYEDRLQGLQKENKRNVHRADQLQARVDQLEDNGKKLTDEIESLRKRHDQFRARAAKKLESTINDQLVTSEISENLIIKNWKNLSYNIYNLVSQCLLSRLPDTTETNDNPTLTKLIPVMRASPKLQGPLLERLIWKKLNRAIFQGTSKVWGGEVGSLVQDICRFSTESRNGLTPDDLAVMSRIKVSAANIIEGSGRAFDAKRSDDEMEEFAEHLYLYLLPFNSDLPSRQVKQDFMKIFDDATSLQRTFMRSRGLFRVGCFSNSLWKDDPFDGDTMEITISLQPRGEKPDNTSTLVKTPSLLVIGTDAGSHFNKTRVLHKASVLLYPKEILTAHEQDQTEEPNEIMKEVHVTTGNGKEKSEELGAEH